MKYSGAALALCCVLVLGGWARGNEQADAYYSAALGYYNAGDFANALGQANSAVGADPGHWQAWQMVGNCKYAQGDKAGALEAYGRSLAINPNNPQLKSFVEQQGAGQAAGQAPASEDSCGKSVALYNAQDYKGALEMARAATEKNPNDAQSWQMVGNCLYAQGDKAGALEAYNKCLAINPDNPQLATFVASLRSEVATKPAEGEDKVKSGLERVQTAGGADAGQQRYQMIGVFGGVRTVALEEALSDFRGHTELFTGFYKAVYPALFAGNEIKTEIEKPPLFKVFGIDGEMGINQWVIRARFLYLASETISAHSTLEAPGYKISDKLEAKVSALSLSLGVGYRIDLPANLFVIAGPTVGFGVAGAKITRETGIVDPASPEYLSSEADTSSFVVPLGAEVEGGMFIMRKFKLYARVGYVFEYAPAMTLDDKGGVKAEDESMKVTTTVLVDKDDNPIPFDLSGAYFHVGVIMSMK